MSYIFNYYGSIAGIIPEEILDLLPFSDICIFEGYMPIYSGCHCPAYWNSSIGSYDLYSDCHYRCSHSVIIHNNN